MLIFALKNYSFWQVRLRLLQMQGCTKRGCVTEVRSNIYLQNIGVAVVCTSNGDTGEDFVFNFFIFSKVP